ncbi:MAG: VOC family protein [Candidatus Heimdallarchaeota archaeon]|nr:MAG: VOC family protein [Candidatus Heimdallarchaeota archaeon]
MTKIHHVGIAVTSIEKELDFHIQALNMRQVSAIIDDKNLNVRVVLLAINGQPNESCLLELVEPTISPSPIDTILQQNNHIYHYCIEIPSLEEALKKARKNHAVIALPPTPAALFNGRRIAFVWTPTKYLIEFLEQE